MEEFLMEEDESNDDIEVKNDIYNYKGYFVENEEEEEKKFFEFGAHFPYKYLCQKLEIIAKEREEEQKELENKLKEKEDKLNNIPLYLDYKDKLNELNNLLLVVKNKIDNYIKEILIK